MSTVTNHQYPATMTIESIADTEHVRRARRIRRRATTAERRFGRFRSEAAPPGAWQTRPDAAHARARSATPMI